LSGWVRRTAGGGDLLIRNGAASPKTNCRDNIVIFTSSVWVRFCTFFDTFGAGGAEGDFKPRFSSSIAGTDFIFDDCSLTELSSGGAVFFEPGPFGKRLQMKPGAAALFEDGNGPDNNSYLNLRAFTIACHFLPTYHVDMDCTIIMKAVRDYDSEATMRWDNNRFGGTISVDGTEYKLEGASGEFGMIDWWGGHRGTRGVVFKYDGLGVFDTSFQAKAFIEKINPPGTSPDGALSQAVEPEDATIVPSSYPAADSSYNRILLGDVGHWDALWTYQYGMEDERCAVEAVAKQPPRFDNRVFNYGAVIAAGAELIIDLERGTVELWNGSTLANAFASVTGSLPDLGDDVPVLLVEGGLKGVQIFGKGAT
jgi:hypothetical protein